MYQRFVALVLLACGLLMSAFAHAQQVQVPSPTCEDQRLTEEAWGSETLALAKVRKTGLRALFRAQLTVKDQRIAELEKQLAEAKKAQEQQVAILALQVK